MFHKQLQNGLMSISQTQVVFPLQPKKGLALGSGSVGRAVTSVSRGPQFLSRYWHNLF